MADDLMQHPPLHSKHSPADRWSGLLQFLEALVKLLQEHGVAFHQRTPEVRKIFCSSCRWAECTNTNVSCFSFPDVYVLIYYDKQIQFWLLGWDLKPRSLLSPSMRSSLVPKFTGVTKKARHNNFPVLLEKEQESGNGRSSINCGSCPVICHQQSLF